MSQVGNCRLLFGPMFSDKTTTLCRELTTLADVGLKVLYINTIKDKRITEAQDDNVTTHHSGFKGLSPKVTAIKTKLLSDVNISNYDAVGIDEGQFFDDLDLVVRDWVLKKAKIVIVASLDGDFMMRPFGKAHNLICLCEPKNIVKFTAKCEMCMRKSSNNGRKILTPAPYTAKFNIDPNIIESGDYTQEDAGGKEKYMPVCMVCYQKHMALSKEEIVIPAIEFSSPTFVSTEKKLIQQLELIPVPQYQ